MVHKMAFCIILPPMGSIKASSRDERNKTTTQTLITELYVNRYRRWFYIINHHNDNDHPLYLRQVFPLNLPSFSTIFS
jgi:hypothetical protein